MRLFRHPLSTTWSYVGVSLLALCLIQLHIGNAGGTGKNLPQTAISWGLMSLSALFMLWRTRHLPWFFTSTSVLFLVATVILWLPWFMTVSAWRPGALWPLLGLTAGILFYFIMLQHPWTLRQVHIVLLFIVLAVVMQTLLALGQTFLPNAIPDMFNYPQDPHGRPTGVFQQVNLLASFTTTGLGIALLLTLQPTWQWANVSHEVLRRGGLYVSLFVFSLLLVRLQSRIGWLTGLSVVVWLLFTCGRPHLSRIVGALAFIITGVLFGMGSFWLQEELPVTHGSSNLARVAMLRDTFAMIAEHPWLGWGYGGFEYQFSHYRLQHGISTLGVGIVTHPHNEILYRWVEGGLLGLLGMGLFFVAGGLMLKRAICREKQLKSPSQVGLFIGFGGCLLPLVLHTQTEYPLYLSAYHWGLLLLLLALWERLSTDYPIQQLANNVGKCSGQMLLAIFMAGTLLFTVTGGYSGWLLWRFEQQQFQAPFPHYWQINPWLLAERAEYDEQVASLLAFNQDRKLLRLHRYAIWAKDYSGIHVDRQVYTNLVQILQAQGLSDDAVRWGTTGYGLFPDDPRFRFVLHSN